MSGMLTTIGTATWDMGSILLRYRHILQAITWVEFGKRYSGSTFGKLWIVLHPLLLLSIYLFVYMVIFRMRFPGYSEFDYVLYVFCGLVPFLGLSESLTTGCAAIKQNMHLVRNLMLPIELLPVRAVAVGMASQVVSLGILVVLAGIHGSLSWRVIGLPAVFALQLAFLVGIVWILSALAVALPDVNYFVNLSLMLLMFISPIGFKPDMVPPSLWPMIYLNPVYYLTEAYRGCLLADHPTAWWAVLAYVVLCLGTFALGSAFFRKFKLIIVDYE